MQKNRRVYSSFSRGEVVYVDLGTQPHRKKRRNRTCVVVSSNASNHCRAPQITVCPLTTRIKDKPVHVQIKSDEVNGYHLKQLSDLLAEDIVTVSKDAVRGTVGFIKNDSEVMDKINFALKLHLGMIEPQYKEREVR